MVGIELASAIIILITVVSIMLMRNVAKTARCPECQHCKLIVQKEIDKISRTRIETNHRNFHYWTSVDYKTCDDPDCEGRK